MTPTIGAVVRMRGLSQRGRNRVHEHAPLFTVRRVRDDGALLLESRDGWYGWLTAEEATVIDG